MSYELSGSFYPTEDQDFKVRLIDYDTETKLIADMSPDVFLKFMEMNLDKITYFEFYMNVEGTIEYRDKDNPDSHKDLIEGVDACETL